jgi:hypothetical protein
LRGRQVTTSRRVREMDSAQNTDTKTATNSSAARSPGVSLSFPNVAVRNRPAKMRWKFKRWFSRFSR